MNSRSASTFALLLALLFVFAGTTSAQVYIQEYCNDPLGAVGLDTNLDGVLATSSSQSDDEFVEIVNAGQASVDISGWTVADNYAVRHTFDGGTNLPGGCSVVVFGGGDVTNFNSLGGATGILASTGSIGLNNSSDAITVADSTGTPIDVQAYTSGGTGDGNGESITRDPEAPGSAFVKHTTLGGAATLSHSAGYRNDGVTAYCGAQVAGVSYPGNGTDAALEIRINGSVHNAGNNVHPIAGGDDVSFNCSTPLGGLNGGQFILAFYTFTTSSPAAPLTLPGDAAAAIWLAPSVSGVIVDGFSSAGALFAPTLSTYGFNYGSVAIPAAMTGTGTSIMLQIVTSDVGINAVNIGAADAHELEIL